jgi:hypothetical protein
VSQPFALNSRLCQVLTSFTLFSSVMSSSSMKRTT